MAILTSNGDGTFKLAPTAAEVTAVTRGAAEAGGTAPLTPIKFMEAKITGWIRDLASKQQERDGATLQAKYDAASPAVKAQVNALLP